MELSISSIFEDSPNAAVTIKADAAIAYGKILEAEVDTSDDADGSSGSTGVTNMIFGTTTDEGDFMNYRL